MYVLPNACPVPFVDPGLKFQADGVTYKRLEGPADLDSTVALSNNGLRDV